MGDVGLKPTPKRRHYHGITYLFPFQWEWLQNLWKKFLCSRGYHLLDECLSDDHYLFCDACDMSIFIEKIETPAKE